MEAAYAVLADQAPELVARLDANGVFLFVSSAGEALLGYAPNELKGSVFGTLLAAGDRERIGPLLTLGVHRWAAERQTAGCTLVRKDGQSLMVELTAYVPEDGITAPRQTVIVVRDASAQAARERDARESEARMRMLMNAVPGMIYQITSHGAGERRFTFCNDWPYTALGIDPTSLSDLDQQLDELVHPDDLREARARWERAATNLEPWVWRGRFIPRPGEELHVVGHSTPQKQPDGSVLWNGVLLDDTPRQRIADALAQTEELFAAVVQNMEMAHVRLDLAGDVSLVNSAGLRMLGYQDAGQLIGKNAAHQLWVSPARFQELFDQVLRGGVAAVEVPLRCRDGSLRVVQGALRLLRDEQQRAIAIDAVVRDVTDERRASEELLFAREAAVARSRSTSTFLATMSNQVRSPMDAIISLSKQALAADPSPTQRDYLRQIHGTGTQLRELIDDILEVSKIEAGKIRLEPEPFALDLVLDAVSSAISTRAAERKLKVVFAVDPRIPDELVGDPRRLGQVLTNLANNAVLVTEHGEVVVSVEQVARDEARARLRFAVRDAGLKLNNEQRDRLFDPFSQTDDASAERPGGAGLGLTISQQLVSLMGTKIVVHGQPEQGSEFSFELWLGVRTRARSLPPKALRDARDLKVLVVDDSQVARDALTRNQLAVGCTVCAVPSAGAARDAMLHAEQCGAPFQLALLDMDLPTTDALELARQIGTGESVHKAPKLVVVSSSAQSELASGRDLPQGSAFLRKPINRSTLLDTIVELVHDHAVEPKSAAPVDVVPKPVRKERKRPLAESLLLVVEDNEINQILAHDLLEAAGAKVVLASSGPEALRVAAQQTPPFDLILMDVQMPGMDGHEATRALRAEAKTEHTPIVAMTAHAFEAERKKCLASGMNAHIAKPINPTELVQAVLAWVRPPALSEPPKVGEVLRKEQSSSPNPGHAQATPVVAPRTAPASEGPPEETGFDPSLLAIVFREPAKQLAFLRKFVDSARRTLGELDGAWQRRAHDDISFAGHKLKSSAKACGAHSLATVCADLERYGKVPDWARLDPLRGIADRLLDDVASYVEQLEANAPQSAAPTKV